MSLNVIAGLFKKRKVNDMGMITNEKIPFLPKTLAKFVYMGNGESIDHAMQVQQKKTTDLSTTLENVVKGDMTLSSFPTFATYEAALQDGTADNTKMYIIEEG